MENKINRMKELLAIMKKEELAYYLNAVGGQDKEH